MASISLMKIAEKMKLENLTPEINLKGIKVTLPDINRPALPMAGYFEHFEATRLQVIGFVEYSYVKRMSEKEEKEMLELAEQRVAKLKARGYEHAGVYNPEGVGGTHVMYVLHHADQPELYHGLPKDPKIDTSVSLWKGALKPLAAAGFIATFAGLIFHYIGIGPNKEVDDDEEDHHE